MGKIVGVVVVIFAALAGLVAWNKHQLAVRDRAYAQTLVKGRADRTAIADKYRVAAVARLKAIEAIIAEAKAAPPITARMPLSAPLAPAPTLTELGYAATGDTIFAGVDQPEATKVRLVPSFGAPASRYLDDRFSDVDTMNLEGVEDTFKQLEKLRYALLIRVQAVTNPSAGADNRFSGGSAAGDGALYELATGKRLGAFPFAVVQADTASVGKRGGDVDAQLLKSFTYDVMSGVKAEFQAFLENKPGPASPGVAADESLARFGRKISLELGLSYPTAGIRAIEVTHGEARPIVTFRAETPKVLMPGGKVTEEIVAAVKKVLGADAEIRVVPATP